MLIVYCLYFMSTAPASKLAYFKCFWKPSDSTSTKKFIQKLTSTNLAFMFCLSRICMMFIVIKPVFCSSQNEQEDKVKHSMVLRMIYSTFFNKTRAILPLVYIGITPSHRRLTVYWFDNYFKVERIIACAPKIWNEKWLLHVCLLVGPEHTLILSKRYEVLPIGATIFGNKQKSHCIIGGEQT